MRAYFNPRSLTGATRAVGQQYQPGPISIHAPSRERLENKMRELDIRDKISIHAPSRERRFAFSRGFAAFAFQSTLPHGSDQRYHAFTKSFSISIHAPSRERLIGCSSQLISNNFNPRSLTGATIIHIRLLVGCPISIHAPSRERRRHI